MKATEESSLISDISLLQDQHGYERLQPCWERKTVASQEHEIRVFCTTSKHLYSSSDLLRDTEQRRHQHPDEHDGLFSITTSTTFDQVP